MDDALSVHAYGDIVLDQAQRTLNGRRITPSQAMLLAALIERPRSIDAMIARQVDAYLARLQLAS